MTRLALVLTLLLPQEPAADFRPGLIGEFFELQGEVEDFPTLTADKKPALRRIDTQVNFETTEAAFGGTGLTDKFYVRWTGVLRVAIEGKYTIYTESDDGSRFFVGDTKVVDNGGLHTMEEKSGEIELKPGDHPIRLELFDNQGAAGCRLSWEGPGIAKAVIPDKVLFHKKDKDLDKD
ncbi:MAG TPA: PA14 domain-containing protein [Planctomycetota bacterium]